jgi:folate-binding protein YgfZ
VRRREPDGVYNGFMTEATEASAQPLPLADLHRRLGAAFTALDAGPASLIQAVARYGEVAAEVRALRAGCGLLDRSFVGRLELTGADRQRFLNGLVTCDVKALAPGAGTYGFFTSIKGRILFDIAVLALADRLRLELPPGSEAAVGEHLGKYRIADRVEFSPLTAALPLTLIGPRTPEVLAAAGSGFELAEPAWSSAGGELAGFEVVAVRQGLVGAPAVTLWVAAGEAAGLLEALLAVGCPAGLVPVGVEAAEVVRAEAGIPRFGRDFGADHFPQETGLDEAAGAVSYTKGCYLGQEVVARIHYRGGVNRLLRGVRFEEGTEAPNPGTALRFEEREAGVATTVVRSPALDRTIGLAILHQRAAEPGTVLEIAGGGRAEVVELPFV